MAEYDVRVKVISRSAKCGAGHNVGDEWIVGGKSPEGICMNAFGALLPNLRVLRFSGMFPFGNDPNVITVACPDARNPLVFELRRDRLVEQQRPGPATEGTKT